ncbi:MAG: NgoFVII family restriction endonuclease [Planctomycetaceae bacterium]|nr:NgoFVII family restriction endonuclease [Planctomycetaceae bacterium]
MIELLNSNYLPLKTVCRSFSEVFFTLLGSAERIHIASGYVSEDAIADLLGIYEKGYSKELNLIVGMGWFEGFPAAQYDALARFGDLLSKKELGNVFVANRFKYHGKVYSFFGKDNSYSAVVGSSNLTRIDSQDKVYDTDILITGDNVNAEIEKFLADLQRYSVPIQKVKLPAEKIIEPKNLFADYLDVEQVSEQKLCDIQSSLTDTVFVIPIKPEMKSHLNCYFGRPRMNNGIARPRDWYEANIIVSKKITGKRDYPKREFTAITDDGYKFQCESNGDYHKNLRSSGDLKIIGRWLKGRMEQKRKLQIGEMVDEGVLENYGRDNFTMTKTNLPDTWYLDFSTEK